MDLLKNTQTKSSFSIDSLLDRGQNEDQEEDEVTPLTEERPLLVKPTPRLPFEDQRELKPTEVETKEINESNSEEEAAITAALHSSLFYSHQPSNILYSQWLASRNTNALFGLQGMSYLLIGGRSQKTSSHMFAFLPPPPRRQQMSTSFLKTPFKYKYIFSS